MESLAGTVAGTALMGYAQKETTEQAWGLEGEREGAKTRGKVVLHMWGEEESGSQPPSFLLLPKPVCFMLL